MNISISEVISRNPQNDRLHCTYMQEERRIDKMHSKTINVQRVADVSRHELKWATPFSLIFVDPAISVNGSNYRNVLLL